MDLAFDLAGNAGWAAGEPGGPIRTGSMKFVEGKVGMKVGRLYAAAERDIEDLITLINPKRVIFEAPIPPGAMRGKGPDDKDRSNLETIYQLLGLIAMLELVCGRRNIPTFSTARSTALCDVMGPGNGFAKKPAVMAWCTLKGIRVQNDDEADAVMQLLFLHL